MSKDLTDFRIQVRSWLETHCPAAMRLPLIDKERCWGGKKFVFSCDAQRQWLEVMAERGWTVPEWPKEYGGGGLSAPQAQVLREEMDSLGCRPPLDRMSQAVAMLGPILLQLGTPEQKQQHLPPIARGEIRWCQGYSEPGAGSDLASVQTRAEQRGDCFAVNGQKIWTSHADKSDWIFMLVRSNPHVRKHLGISFLLVDLNTPGIEVRLIKLISGKSAFCEVFFDNVKVPVSNVVGEVNRGWDVAKQLLGHERNSIATATSLLGRESLGLLATRLQAAAGVPVLDSELRAEIAQFEVDAWSFALCSERSRDLAQAGRSTDGLASALKIMYSELDQRRKDLALAAAGLSHLEFDDSAELPSQEPTRAWLRSRGNSLEGGTTEIQLNIIAKRALGLPTT